MEPEEQLQQDGRDRTWVSGLQLRVTEKASVLEKEEAVFSSEGVISHLS